MPNLTFCQCSPLTSKGIKAREGQITVEIRKDMKRTGVITSRECPACGHHEMGLVAEDGSFHPLRPGTFVQIVEGFPAHLPEPETNERPQRKSHKGPEAEIEFYPWVPEPLKGDRSLRLKYGVMVEGNVDIDKMNGRIFKAAYIEKLRDLIEREIHLPVPVLLDSFFAAPHLASGNPEEIALAMWQELEEIRQPVELVKAWLKNPDKERFEALIQPRTWEDVSTEHVGERELRNELKQLSLEGFLNLILYGSLDSR
ncbi:MAG: hypothetical protein SV775_05395 [Thermodesulfobacteriota bacterium]|nr:hypothetical protein [Thermodesulfobacteriota bacterium]